MAFKTADVILDGDMRFVGRTGSGHEIVLDNAAGNTGARPTELVLLALAGCTAMDVVSILRKKQQDLRRYSCEVGGAQLDELPNAFTRIDVLHVVDGVAIDPEAVRRAIELSATKYCSVGATLEAGVQVCHRYRLSDTATGESVEGDVVVVGPTVAPAGAVTG